ncbi:hypothetical protein HZC08_00575, partial [Candidatus Micrarchaeota archaeon]|nr:hypothetical protein [Candidatus Micrarchaeota archaeon]
MSLQFKVGPSLGMKRIILLGGYGAKFSDTDGECKVTPGHSAYAPNAGKK